MNGVVFLSYSASERGERWGPEGTGWVVSAIAALCVFICVLMVVCPYKQTRKRRARKGTSPCWIRAWGWWKSLPYLLKAVWSFLLMFFREFSFPQSTASILVSLLFHTKLTHAHFLRFCSLRPAEWGVDQNDWSNRVAARVLKQQTTFSQYNSFLLTIKYPGLIKKKASSNESLSVSFHTDPC